jgi:hypothetical protein
MALEREGSKLQRQVAERELAGGGMKIDTVHLVRAERGRAS